MAILRMSVMSQCLMRTVEVNAVLPVDKVMFPGMTPRGDKPYKTLYLLHGVFGSQSDWINSTRVARYANENDLVVIMPAGDNAFYVDQEKSHNYYGEFVGRELVELTRKMFPLSHRREDTFIGGLSMGGFGALRNGLKYSETFGSIVSLSGALLTESMPKRTNDGPFWLDGRDYAEACFGDLDRLLESDKNPKWIVEQLVKEGKAIPDIYMACGDQDDLQEVNDQMAAFLREKGAKVVYEIGKGGHEWEFWDTYIKKAIYEWLPTERSAAGMNSGNVRADE